MRPFLIINPDSGHADPHLSEDTFNRMCAENKWEGSVALLQEGADLKEIASRAVLDGFNLILAAGGDGTLSGVVNGIFGLDAALVIIPAGTGNGLAKALGVPLTLEEAILLPSRPHQIARMDVMEVDGMYSILNVSTGISARAIQHTDADSKKAGGMLAYIQSFTESIQDVDTYNFHVCIDGVEVIVEASELIISNGTILNDPPFDIYGERKDFFDGRMEIQLVKASRMDQYLGLAWDLLVNNAQEADGVDVHHARRNIRVEVPGKDLRIQVDGDPRGHLPVQVNLHSASLPVLLPAD